MLFYIKYDIIRLVIELGLLENILVTDIEPPMVILFEKSKKVYMKDRWCFGLSLCKSGQITYKMNGKDFVCNEGKAVILPQGQTYSIVGNKDGVFPVINFKCENLDCNEITLIDLENPKVCINDFEALKNHFANNENLVKKMSAFYKLLDDMSPKKSNKSNILQPVTNYIDQNLCNSTLSNTELAKHIGISEVYLRKLFKTHYNASPKQYVLEKRLQKAMQLLLETPYTVTAISADCGFSSPYHFCRAFKIKTGHTPTEYRKQFKTHLF